MKIEENYSIDRNHETVWQSEAMLPLILLKCNTNTTDLVPRFPGSIENNKSQYI